MLFSCNKDEAFDVPMNENIVLDLSTGVSRLLPSPTEAFIHHLDIFIFDDFEGKPYNTVYYGRYNVNNNTSVTLNAKRSSFDAGKNYHVYLVANSNLTETDFSRMSVFDNLLQSLQTDYNLHLSGLTIDNAPKYFLMDAKATDTSGKTIVVLNNGNATDNTILNATLRRAAAKVFIHIKATENVVFKPFTLTDGSEGGLYYLRNMPYDAFLLAEAKEDATIQASVRNTAKGNNEYFTWNPEINNKNVTLTTYVYPNSWSDESILEHETCVVMNLPLTYTSENGDKTDYHNSWYKIPMTSEKMFKRNNYYEVIINLDRPGAISESKPMDIENINYKVSDWKEQTINVGGENKPAYLMVNHKEMEMHNTDFDNTTLEFSSSSPVKITVKDIYYYNKYGVKTTISPNITGSTEEGSIQGNITVNSPIPDNNTIRYFTLVITNEEGIPREVFVKQYPLVYIVNIPSKHSYRSDFIDDDPTGTTTGDHFKNRGSYSRFGAIYSNGTTTYGTSNAFFRSKYVNTTYTSGNNEGLSDVNYYTNNSTPDMDGANEYNARMYHIRITATSNEYILGKPKITNGITDPGEDNARMVSPSFMIASRLGTINSDYIKNDNVSPRDYGAEYTFLRGWTWPEGSDIVGYYRDYYLDVYTEHAKQYVEVYTDPDTKETIHLNDWRLPTAAELEIIYKYQGTQGSNADAIDYLLNGSYYFSASGPVMNPKSNTDGVTIRCVRDVY